MKPLYTYLSPRLCVNDGHVHIFSHRGINKCLANKRMSKPFANSVGFADIELDHLNEYKDIPGMYDKYIKDVPVLYWLATGLTIEDIKNTYNAHPDKIRGFGELKLYDSFKGNDVNFKKISFARAVCRFSEDCGNLPVYIHYELTNDREIRTFDKLLTDFPDIPIVLCHMGMNEENQEYAYNAARKLAMGHGNCWLDISWDAAKWLSQNPMLISQLPTDRCIWGSDISPRLEAHGFVSANMAEIDQWKSVIIKYIDSDKNIRALFNENS